MRFTLVVLAMVLASWNPLHAERIAIQLEWGFGNASDEMYWDGQVRVDNGRLVSMQAKSFESDRHDRMAPPKFWSFTLDKGTDGMELVVEGDDQTNVRLASRQGTFQWTLGELRKQLELRFPSTDGGRLEVRALQSLGPPPLQVSDRTTQDSDPAMCRLPNGRQLIAWRAFLGLPGAPANEQVSGDQIRCVLVDNQGNSGEPFDLFPKPADIERIATAPKNGGRIMVVWSERRDGNWDLFGCHFGFGDDGIQRSETQRLTDDSGVDRSPTLVAEPDGSLALAWQGWRGTSSKVHFRKYANGRWQEPDCLSDCVANDWKPALATAPDGSVAVAWSRWQNGSYDVCLRIRVQEEWSPTQVIANSPRFESHPSLAFDQEGALYILYEQGRDGWGMDSFSAGLRSERNIQLLCYRNGQLQAPQGGAALKLPEALRGRSEMGHLARDGNGVLWLLFRSVKGRGIWNLYGSALSGDGWTPPAEVRQSAAGQDIQIASSPDRHGQLTIVWPSDHRVSAVGRDSWLYRTTLPKMERFAGPLRTTPAKLVTRAIESAKRPARFTRNLGGQTLGLYFGDLHRHTELSVCRTSVDGSVQDAYQYAIDAAGLDFLCITDHVQHVKILNDYDFWRSGKKADLNRVPGLHLPFYGYERSQRFPYGHRNIVSTNRGIKRIPRTEDNRPTDANRGYEGEIRITPPQLWEALVGENVVTVPHTSTSPVMGTDFGHEPAKIEPVVEIYQGCRYTAEYEGAPDPRATRDAGKYAGATQPEGYLSSALAKGYRYGFIASSDHVATHNSYTCVWAEEFSNEAILAALAKRQCFAATDKIQCFMCMGEQLMGSEFSTDTVPPLEVSVVGTTDIDRVDVIKDNRVVYSRQPNSPTREVAFQYQDTGATPGVHYYYARVIQKDRNMAWISPIWVTIEPRPSI